MDSKQCREIFMRARSYFLRNDAERGLETFITALRKLGSGTSPMELRSLCRECLDYVVMDPAIKTGKAPRPTYQPGKETSLLQQLITLRDWRLQSRAEDFSTALARKIKLDQGLNAGKALLAEGRASDADQAFQDALQFYRDEHHAFCVIARAFLQAGEVVRALPYIKKGAQELPNDPQVQKLLEECWRIREGLRTQSAH